MPKIISMKQLREHFTPIRKGLRRGDSYLLMYRSKPLATLVPYQEKSEKPRENYCQNLLQHKKQNLPLKPQKSPYRQSAFNLQTKFTPNSVVSTPNLIAETKSNFAEALKQLQAAAKKTPAIPTGKQTWPNKVTENSSTLPSKVIDNNQAWQNLNRTIAHAQTKSQARHNKIGANTTRITASKPRTNLNKIRKVLAP